MDIDFFNLSMIVNRLSYNLRRKAKHNFETLLSAYTPSGIVSDSLFDSTNPNDEIIDFFSELEELSQVLKEVISCIKVLVKSGTDKSIKIVKINHSKSKIFRSKFSPSCPFLFFAIYR